MSGKAKSRDLSFSRAGLYDPFRGLLTSLAEIFLPQGAMSVLGVVLTDKNPGAKPSTLQPLGPMWLHQGHAWGLPEDSGVALFLKKAAVASAIAARFCTQQSKVVCPILHLSQLLKVKCQRSSSFQNRLRQILKLAQFLHTAWQELFEFSFPVCVCFQDEKSVCTVTPCF